MKADTHVLSLLLTDRSHLCKQADFHKHIIKINVHT